MVSRMCSLNVPPLIVMGVILSTCLSTITHVVTCGTSAGEIEEQMTCTGTTNQAQRSLPADHPNNFGRSS